MVYEILHGGTRIARHGLTGGSDEPGVAILRTSDGLRSYFGRRFRYAGQNRFDERVHERIERLLATTNTEDVQCHAIKACANPLIGSGRLRSPIQFMPDRRTNE
jgi:hypothetical protein